MVHRESDERNVFDYGSVSDVDVDVDEDVDGEDDFMECETVEIERNRGCDNSKMVIPTSDAGPKKYFCKYCKERTLKLERHLRTHHSNEPDVKKYLAFPPRSASRRKIILKILKQGEFKWNNDEKLNGGEYAVRRRQNKKFKKNPWDMITCVGCLGAYSKSYLRRHWNKECAKNRLIGERGLHQLGRAVEGRVHSNASDDLVDVFSSFTENENIRYIRHDWLVVCYGNDLCLNHSPHYQQGYIRGKLTAAGKVLRASKSISTELTDMSSLFHVKHCNTVVEAIRSMGKFDHKTKKFGSPATASTTVTLINAMGELLVIETMKSDDPEKERDVERFLKVFKKDVKTKINKLVAVTRLENRRHKKENIPTTADVNKLAKYVDSEREACYSQLLEHYSYGVWLKLCQMTMVSILIYNRRRAGEMQNLLMEDFEQREMVADQCDMLLAVIPEEAKRKIKSRVTVRNKLGKKLVPVLLKHHWDDCLQLIIRHREEAGIPENNEYLFPLPTQLVTTTSATWLSSWDTLKQYIVHTTGPIH
ncbi:uncharacterized protein LOC119067003 [Bradysia coprophila]|uniref:uncharacterized protein LOC119067003 n=1 Tax=Bradysia coprophila TaxID=38358 RepID=UPI00187DCE9C|nr:uncharacterized protein LOC119067003 [Bradysia coprophila]